MLTIHGKNIMLDCGMHMGYQDGRRFPDFSYIHGNSIEDLIMPQNTTKGDKPNVLTEHIDAVIISHFHLDHCGALPYMTEMVS